MIVDAHHHLWDTRRLRYTLFDGIPALNRAFLSEDYDRVAMAAGIDASICVEAASAGAEGMAELAWLREQADRSSRVKAIVAWAPVGRADLPKYLERVVALRDSRIVSIRRSFEFEPPDFPSRPETVTGVRSLAALGFSFDLVLFHPSLRATIELVRQCPDVGFILDHLGKPPIRLRQAEPWRTELAQLAALPNVVCKISGMTTEADRAAWTVDDLKTYFDTAVESFGWERLLFGSDWPVCDLARGLTAWIEALDGLLSGVPAGDRQRFFSGNAIRVYQLRDRQAAEGAEPPSSR